MGALAQAPGPLCDDCLPRLADVHPRQQVNQRVRQLAAEGRVLRMNGQCESCGGLKLVNSLARTESVEVAHSDTSRQVLRRPKTVARLESETTKTEAKAISFEVAAGTFTFVRAPLSFEGENDSDIFRFKNNKSLEETIQHPRYSHLREGVHKGYAQALERPLGQFLHELKIQGDPFYRAFLNPYGDLVYCSFCISNVQIAGSRGLYLYRVDGVARYVGRCLDNFRKRIDQGYGRIHPKNCFLDGQSTNCRMNSLIAKHRKSVELYVCVLRDKAVIQQAEHELLRKLTPDWNIQIA